MRYRSSVPTLVALLLAGLAGIGLALVLLRRNDERQASSTASTPTPESDRGSRVPPSELHSDRTAYLVSPTAGVFSIATLEKGARTRAGVGVGDELTVVRERYERVECGAPLAGEALPGESPTHRWCRTRVGEVRILFGGDPIESITLTSYGR